MIVAYGLPQVEDLQSKLRLASKAARAAARPQKEDRNAMAAAVAAVRTAAAAQRDARQKINVAAQLVCYLNQCAAAFNEISRRASVNILSSKVQRSRC